MQPATIARIDKELAVLETEIIDFRQTLHMYPELGWEEKETIRRIRQKLTDHQIDSFRMLLETGGVADLVFKPGAPFVMVRADIDALPIQDEKKDKPYRSRHNGKCHACAHDVHTAVTLGAGLILKRILPELAYNVRLVFQPAEEPTPSGAPKMIEQGALENVACALGMHIEPRLPLRTIGLTTGRINMQSIRLDLKISGPGGHSARPSDTADLIWIASRLVQDSYQLVYRQMNLLDSAVILTFTEIEAKQGYNVIPSGLSLTGTLRLVDPIKKATFYDKFKALLRNFEKSAGCKIKLKITEGAPSVNNNVSLTEKLTENTKILFPDSPIADNFRTPGADDFSHYSEQVPAVYTRFGIGGEFAKASLHEGLFDVPRETILDATRFFAFQLMNLGDLNAYHLNDLGV